MHPFLPVGVSSMYKHDQPGYLPTTSGNGSPISNARPKFKIMDYQILFLNQYLINISIDSNKQTLGEWFIVNISFESAYICYQLHYNYLSFLSSFRPICPQIWPIHITYYLLLYLSYLGVIWHICVTLSDTQISCSLMISTFYAYTAKTTVH